MTESELRHGSLFSGIGGFDLAAEWCGWRNIFHCEVNDFCNKVLNFYWPNAASIKNIIGYEWEKWNGKIDVLSGGFPCQPYSVAGKRLGKADPRHLWPAMLAAVRAIQPRWVVGENVRGLLSWNEGVVFNEVQSDLETAGYEVLPLLLPAAGVGAPHKRERIWIVAHRLGIRRNKAGRDRKRTTEDKAFGTNIYGDVERSGEVRPTSETDHREQQKQQEGHPADSTPTPKPRVSNRPCTSDGNNDRPFAERIRQLETGADVLQKILAFANEFKGLPFSKRTGNRSKISKYFALTNWKKWPTQPPVCNGDDGISALLDGLTFSQWRSESIKAGGNAIVPHVAFQIFRVITRLSQMPSDYWQKMGGAML